MSCSCCATSPCCRGAVCEQSTPSQCASLSGTPAASASAGCTSYACVQTTPIDRGLPVGGGLCSVINQCACSAQGADYTFRVPATSCNCNALQSAGVFNGNCLFWNCNVCNTTTGQCVSNCPSPRACCSGTCCPLSQRCQDGVQCVNKCTTGTFCAGAGSAYACCTSGQKCCGSSGCLSTSTANFTVDVAVNDWVNTGVTLATGAGVTITASGTVQWAGAGSTANPDGVTSGACDCCNNESVASSFCHMALIGRIGTTGTPFLVGSSYSGSPGAGLLYLRQNDTVVSDNSGSFAGTVTTDPCPGFTPASVDEPIVFSGPPPGRTGGPGTELKALLRLAGITASPTCSCNARALQMDAWGELECLRRVPEICGWLREEAEKRDLWFFAPAGIALILASISLAALKRPVWGNSK